MKNRTYISAPYRGKNRWAVEQNISIAGVFAEMIGDVYEDIPIVIHNMVRDVWGLGDHPPGDPIDDEIIKFNKIVFDACDKLAVCGDAITAGMEEEIKWAEDKGMPIVKISMYDLQEWLLGGRIKYRNHIPSSWQKG